MPGNCGCPPDTADTRTCPQSPAPPRRTSSPPPDFPSPDAIAPTPDGFIFVAKDGLRIFQGQSSRRFGRDIKRRLMERILVEPRARDNLSMAYENGILYIAYAGMEVA